MKILMTLSLYFSCLFFNTLKCQNVSIPNVAFKNYLVNNTAINTNGDTEIQVSEAIAFSGTIDCGALGITNSTGIEAFVNLSVLKCPANQIPSLNLSQLSKLEELICNHNWLTSLDVSQNTKLQTINGAYNGISSLDLSQNTDLTSLNLHGTWLTSLDLSQNINLITIGCGSTPLTSLDLSQNINLQSAYINNNQITNLDLSANSSLRSLNCSNNQLTSLNVQNGNNSNSIYFLAQNNPNLSCIKVDDVAYSSTNWTDVDSLVTFDTTCAITTTITQAESKLENISAYPNPTHNNLTLNLGQLYPTVVLEVSTATGQILTKKTIQEVRETNLAFEDFLPGLYFVRIQTKEGTRTLKVIKQ